MPGLVGWQEYAVVSNATLLQTVDIALGVSPSRYLGALGKTGLTAWLGMHEIGKPRPGDIVVVSAASGAVGSVASQLAKVAGAWSSGSPARADIAGLIANGQLTPLETVVRGGTNVGKLVVEMSG